MAIMNCFPLVDAELDNLYKNSGIFPANVYFEDSHSSSSYVKIYEGPRVGFDSIAESGLDRDHSVTFYPLRTFYIKPTLRGVTRSADAIKAEPGHAYMISVKISSNYSRYHIYKDGTLIYEYPVNTLSPNPNTDDGTLLYWSYTNQ